MISPYNIYMYIYFNIYKLASTGYGILFVCWMTCHIVSSLQQSETIRNIFDVLDDYDYVLVSGYDRKMGTIR